jgi:c-di-GMP-binding flagellar brake protein YcgR
MMNNFTDRRRYDRIRVSLNVKYETNGKVSTESVSVTKDISEVGLALDINRFVKPGDRVKLELKIPGYYIPVLGTASVIWTRKEKDSYNVPAGLRFLQFSEEDRKKLFSFIRQERGDNAFEEESISRNAFRLQPTP